MFIKRGFSLGDKVKSLVSIETIEGTFTENHVFTIAKVIDETDERGRLYCFHLIDDDGNKAHFIDPAKFEKFVG
jgi:hypothetical protein